MTDLALPLYLRGLPGRCAECGYAPSSQGHAPDCQTPTPPRVPSEPEPIPVLPPMAWTEGLTCDAWHDASQSVCGATEGVRHYLTGARCPACTPQAQGINPARVHVPPPPPVEPVPEWSPPEPEQPPDEPTPEPEAAAEPEPPADAPPPPEAAEPEPPADAPPPPEAAPEPAQPEPEVAEPPAPEPTPEDHVAQPDMSADEGLFEHEKPAAVSLADKFAMPPMSVLDRRAGEWQARRRRWLSLGMQSELGRIENGEVVTAAARTDAFADLTRRKSGATGDLLVGISGASVFDPVVCELAYRWHTRWGDRVLDPFAGGSVRGLVGSVLGRRYLGVELREPQVAANRAQAHLATGPAPQWLQGDSADVVPRLTDDYDMVFSCPPYADLERYSDDPADLSTMEYETFTDAHRQIIAAAAERLRPDRFAVYVVSDVRSSSGGYRGFVVDTIRAWQAAGLTLHNDAILLDPVGTGAIRAERPFRSTRKLTRCHQHMLVFVKGDAKRAAQRLEAAE